MARTQYSVRTVKTFNYRGDPLKEFSNRYYFDGAAPADANAWHDLMDAVVLQEKAIYSSDVHIVGAFGYGLTSEVAIASKTYTTAGTLTLTGASFVPGDCAAVMRMATTKLSVKNHTVYVFSYFHGVHGSTAGAADDLFANQKTQIDNFGAAWQTGITAAGGRVYKRTTPDGHATTGHLTDPWIGHRDFPR